MRNKFVIAHVQPGPFVDPHDIGKAEIISIRAQLAAGPFSTRPHKTRARQYSGMTGVQRYGPRELRPGIKGFTLRLATSDGVQYVQRNGIRYRLDRLVRAGRVDAKELRVR